MAGAMGTSGGCVSRMSDGFLRAGTHLERTLDHLPLRAGDAVFAAIFCRGHRLVGLDFSQFVEPLARWPFLQRRLACRHRPTHVSTLASQYIDPSTKRANRPA